MLKVATSRGDIIGQLNNLPDVVLLSDTYSFGHTVSQNSGLTDEVAVKDTTCHCSLCSMINLLDGTQTAGIDIGSKAFMIDRGFVSLPTMEYGARLGALEASDLTQNPRSVTNPIADEGAVSVAVGSSFSGAIDFTGDTDDIRVFLVAGQTYLVSLRGTSPSAVKDTFLEVYNPSAALVNFDDDGGNGTNSLLTFTAAATGNFTIRASSFANPGDPGTGGYTVDVKVQGVDAVGDTNATAVVLNYGTTFGFRETATVSGGADLDRYEVQLEAGKFYTFKLAAGADYATDYTAVPAGEIDTILRLRNAGGTLVAQSDDNTFPTDISSGFGFLATVTGTYYLDVTGYAGQTGGYVIDFQNIVYQDEDPLQSIRWVNADNIDTVPVNGNPTAYVYFGAAGETFSEPGIVTFGWNATEKAAVMNALLEYTKITGITYLETTDINQAEFRLNTVSTGNFGAYFYPQDPAYGAQEGIGIFNVNSGGWDKPGVSTQDIPGNQVSLDKGGFAYAVILHEFGHAHGLAHPHDNGGGSDIMLGVTAPTGSYGIFNLNQGVYTVMSYNDAWDFHPDGPSPFTIQGIGNGWSGTLGAFDIAALQERYGVHAYNTGDNVYVLSAVQQTGVYYETIWDTGGTDTIAYYGTGNARIDLTAATLDYSPTGGGVLSFVDQIPGTAGLDGIFGGYTIANGVVIENAEGGSGSDVLIGNDVANKLYGGGGTDTLMGRDGNDFLDGGAGVDAMTGGTGDDVYVVDAAGDVVNELVGEGNDRVLAQASFALAAGSEVELLLAYDVVGTSALNLTGNEFAQTVVGNDGANTLYGGGGDDTINGLADNDFIDGGTGADRMYGGTGNDTLVVDNAGDQVFALAGEGTDDRVLTKINYTLAAGADIELVAAYDVTATSYLFLFGNELGQVVIGNDGTNYLNGLGGDDTIYGLGGDDMLVGGLGADRLIGGAGADQFVFNTALGAGNIDQILDFTSGTDTIALDDAVFTGLSMGGLSASAFVAGTAALDADDRIIYNAATGALFFDADGNGAGAAVQFATLAPATTLTSTDFVVV